MGGIDGVSGVGALFEAEPSFRDGRSVDSCSMTQAEELKRRAKASRDVLSMPKC
jgi:hypothetical protein